MKKVLYFFFLILKLIDNVLVKIINKSGKNQRTIEWKCNRAVFFSRLERETWHSYKGDEKSNRVALVYNLMTNRIKQVYKAEKKSYIIGSLRYKLNPYIYKLFKKTL